MLLCLVILFNPETVDDLEDRQAVEHAHKKYLLLLHRYLKAKFGERGNAKLHLSAMLMAHTKTFYGELTSRLDRKEEASGGGTGALTLDKIVGAMEF